MQAKAKEVFDKAVALVKEAPKPALMIGAFVVFVLLVMAFAGLN